MKRAAPNNRNSNGRNSNGRNSNGRNSNSRKRRNVGAASGAASAEASGAARAEAFRLMLEARGRTDPALGVVQAVGRDGNAVYRDALPDAALLAAVRAGHAARVRSQLQAAAEARVDASRLDVLGALEAAVALPGAAAADIVELLLAQADVARTPPVGLLVGLLKQESTAASAAVAPLWRTLCAADPRGAVTFAHNVAHFAPRLAPRLAPLAAAHPPPPVSPAAQAANHAFRIAFENMAFEDDGGAAVREAAAAGPLSPEMLLRRLSEVDTDDDDDDEAPDDAAPETDDERLSSRWCAVVEALAAVDPVAALPYVARMRDAAPLRGVLARVAHLVPPRTLLALLGKARRNRDDKRRLWDSSQAGLAALLAAVPRGRAIGDPALVAAMEQTLESGRWRRLRLFLQLPLPLTGVEPYSLSRFLFRELRDMTPEVRTEQDVADFRWVVQQVLPALRAAVGGTIDPLTARRIVWERGLDAGAFRDAGVLQDLRAAGLDMRLALAAVARGLLFSPVTAPLATMCDGMHAVCAAAVELGADPAANPAELMQDDSGITIVEVGAVDAALDGAGDRKPQPSPEAALCAVDALLAVGAPPLPAYDSHMVHGISEDYPHVFRRLLEAAEPPPEVAARLAKWPLGSAARTIYDEVQAARQRGGGRGGGAQTRRRRRRATRRRRAH